MRRKPAVQKRDDGGRGGVDVRGAWVHLLVFEVTVRNIMAVRVPVRSYTD